ncbi:MAG: sulfur carrier protein ThiS [Chloroflexota bacterium]|nr:sulfur carrier protein ThiS [Chloroflexota bacterium]
MIRLTVNGKPRELPGPTGLVAFLESLGVNVQFVAVAHKGNVLAREDFSGVSLQDGDVLEVVRPVGGGSH